VVTKPCMKTKTVAAVRKPWCAISGSGSSHA
jgi:hypothetical protein